MFADVKILSKFKDGDWTFTCFSSWLAAHLTRQISTVLDVLYADSAVGLERLPFKMLVTVFLPLEPRVLLGF